MKSPVTTVTKPITINAIALTRATSRRRLIMREGRNSELRAYRESKGKSADPAFRQRRLVQRTAHGIRKLLPLTIRQNRLRCLGCRHGVRHRTIDIDEPFSRELSVWREKRLTENRLV